MQFDLSGRPLLGGNAPSPGESGRWATWVQPCRTGAAITARKDRGAARQTERAFEPLGTTVEPSGSFVQPLGAGLSESSFQQSETGANAAPGLACEALFLPNLLKLLQSVASDQSRREQNEERQQENLRRKEARREQVATELAVAQQPSDYLRQAELDLLPGSRAAWRQEWHQQVRQQLWQDQTFQPLPAGVGNADENQSPEVRREPDPAGAANKLRSDSAQTSAPGPTDKQPHAGRPVALGLNERPPAATVGEGTLPTRSAVSDRMPTAFQLLPADTLPKPVLASAELSGSDLATGRKGQPSALESRPSTLSSGVRLGPTQAGLPVAREASVPGGRGTANRTGGPSRSDQAAPWEAESGNFDPNIERIVRLLQTRIGQDRSVAMLRLDPPELGTVRLRMDLREDQLSLRIETQTETARRLLSDQLEDLRRNLEATGIHLERAELRTAAVGHEPGESGSPQQPGDHQLPARGNDQSAGHGSQPDSEAWREAPGTIADPLVERTDEESPQVVGPAAESLVNLLA